MPHKSLLLSARALSRPPSFSEFLGSELSFHILSWGLFIYCVVSGLFKIPDAIYGGMYSNTDGQWAAWNAEFILRYGHFLDPSPYNAFAGMGSMFLPNLPWVNPAALMLGLPLPALVKYAISYLVYFVELAGSTIILGRALNFSWLAASVAAQLHILILFPPFSHVFGPLEWYSSAPMYAQLSSILNVVLALFLSLGKKSAQLSFAAGVLAIPALTVVGFLTAPFSFVFFFPPYVTLALFVGIVTRPNRQEMAWKAASLLTIVATLLIIGIPDYLRAMMENSARSPTSPVLWNFLFSPTAWWDALRHHSICVDARALICAQNSLYWFQLLALIGSAGLLFQSAIVLRTVGAWGLLYTAGVHLYAIAYQSGWLGPIGTLSTHFLSWASYSLLVLPAVAVTHTALKLVLHVTRIFYERLHTNVSQDAWERINARLISFVTVLERGRGLWCRQIIFLLGTFFLSILIARHLLSVADGIVSSSDQSLTLFPYRTTSNGDAWQLLAPVVVAVGTAAAVLWSAYNFGVLLLSACLCPANRGILQKFSRFAELASLLLVIPVAASLLLPTLQRERSSRSTHAADRIVRRLTRDTKLELGTSFRGYVATVWSPALNRYDPYHMAETAPVFRYIAARQYFEKTYHTTFTEMDLWANGIPTFEEYGQWVSVQAQELALNLFADEQTRHAPPHASFLRIYAVNVDVMRALGIRYLISDYSFDDKPELTLLVSESAHGAIPVHLYELSNPNLGTFSPTNPIVVRGGASTIFSAILEEPHALDNRVYVSEPLYGPFEKATRASMTLIRDGYRVKAQSDGRSLLLLPVQFSHCLTATSEGDHKLPKLMRADFLNTLVVFDKSLDVSIRFKFGFFGNSACRYQDAADVNALINISAPRN